MTLTLWEVAARDFEAPVRRFATPGDLAKFCEPSTLQTPALDLIDEAVVKVMDGVITKLQLAAPPQTGKSERVSRWTPLWMLLCDPTLRIVIVSADLELARRWGRKIKRMIDRTPALGLSLQADSQAAGRWETIEGGSLTCVGISAGTTGLPIDVLVVDDPVKDRAQAESSTQRTRIWEFWENDGGARARKTILMATRWHSQDLAGMLQEKEPGEWTVLSIPAIAESPDDPLGRDIGEEIASANPKLHPPGYYLKRSSVVSAYVWSSVFQQRPSAAEGNIFKRGEWRFWTYDQAPDGHRWLHLVDEQYSRDERFDLNGCSRFITIDLAASKRTSADWTVASAWAITSAGDLVLLDRVRDRVAEIDHGEFIRPLRERWLNPYDVVHIEQSMQTSTLVYALGRSGVPIAPLKADADKLTRALPYAGLVRQGKVFLPRAAQWIDSWIDEHADFRGHDNDTDDQVDTGSYAARVAIAHWLPPEPAEATEPRRMAAYSTDDIPDLMNAIF
jgi:predicted phage terminase large subunit-like protein